MSAAVVLALVLLAPLAARGRTITEIIDATGDGLGHTLQCDRLLPCALTVDDAGNAYVSGSGSNNVFRITAAGAISQILDATGDGDGHVLTTPVGLAVDASGNVYVSGFASNNVLKRTPSGTVTEILAAAGDGAGHDLSGPFGVAVDGSGNVYVAGFTSNNVFRVTPGGVVSEIIDVTGDGGGNALIAPIGVATDTAGAVYVAAALSENAFRISPGGAVEEIIDTTGDGTRSMASPRSVAVDAAGNVLVNGYATDNVFRIASDEAVSQILDGTASLSGPAGGLAVDGSGNYYVSGYASSNVVRVAPGGTVQEMIDAGGDETGNPLTGAHAVATDAAGNVYVSGNDSHNVFRIDFAPQGHGIVGAKLLIVDKAMPGVPPATTRKLVFVAKQQAALHHDAGFQSGCGDFGSPTCTAVAARLELIDVGNPANRAVFEMKGGRVPVGGSEGWRADGPRVARFINQGAAEGAGTTGVKVLVCKPGQPDPVTGATPGLTLKAVAASLGDGPALAMPISGDGALDVVLSVGEHTFCARFDGTSTLLSQQAIGPGPPVGPYGYKYVAKSPTTVGSCL